MPCQVLCLHFCQHSNRVHGLIVGQVINAYPHITPSLYHISELSSQRHTPFNVYERRIPARLHLRSIKAQTCR